MDQMEIIDAKPKAKTRRLKNEARTVRMPEFPPGAKPGVDSYREVKLYIVDKRRIWSHRNDVEWALRYIFMEIKLNARDTVGSAGDMGPDQDWKKKLEADLEEIERLRKICKILIWSIFVKPDYISAATDGRGQPGSRAVHSGVG